jgi:phage gp46-like protein
MQDTKHVLNSDGLIVLAIEKKDFAKVDGLETACLVSIMTDSRLDETEVSDPIKRGGWIGSVVSGRELGCKLYALEQARISTGLIGKSKEAAARAFDWMITDGVSRNIENSVTIQLTSINHDIKITGRDGVKYDYRYLWQKTRPFTLR